MPEVERRRKRPLVIEMLLWDGANLPQVIGFIGGEDLASWEAGGLRVWNDQEKAWMAVPVGHRVAKGALGELYPMSPGAYEDTTEPEREYLTAPEAAARLRVSKMTVHRLILAGVFPAKRFGGSYRIREEDLRAYIDAADVMPGEGE